MFTHSNRANWVRVVFGAITVLVLALNWVSFEMLWTSPNDENWFTTNRHPVAIQTRFPAKPIKGSIDNKGPEPGDLIVSIADHAVNKVQDVDEILKSIDAFEPFDLAVLKPNRGYTTVYKVSRQMLPKDWVRALPPSVIVIDVAPGGASERAGMQKGDLIIRIDGRGFNDALEADRIMRGQRAGEQVRYDILRANHLMSLNVTMAKFGIPLHLVIVRMVGLVFIAFGAFLWLARPGIKAARINGLAFCLLGGALGMEASDKAFGLWGTPAWMATTKWFALTVGIAVLIHGRYYFPREMPSMLHRSWTRYVPYFFAVTLTLFGLRFGNALFFRSLSLWRDINGLFIEHLPIAARPHWLKPSSSI